MNNQSEYLKDTKKWKFELYTRRSVPFLSNSTIVAGDKTELYPQKY